MLSAFGAGRFFGRRYGTGVPRVLALHGWRRDHHDWDGVLEEVDAVALDLPGFGATPPPPASWDTTDYAGALRPVLDELEAPIVVAGHSFGGRVAVRLAALEPQRVGALVLTGTPSLWPVDGSPARPPARAFRFGRWLHRRGVLSDARMETLRRRHGSADYRAADGVMRDVLVRAVNERYDDALRTLRCPVELVWGTADDAAPVTAAREAAAALANVHLDELPGVGHFTLDDAPAAVRDAIARALAAVAEA